ncbi:MAG: Rieske 2Fe-2S domain-containing protein [Pseudomonadota bacterium]
MSVKFTPVQWTQNKWFYDAALLAAVVTYILVYIRLGNPTAELTRPVDGSIVRMRAFGSCAFFMLSMILIIGPLARLDRRFLPLLYNRRHFGVMTAVVAATHAFFVLGWYYAFSPTPPYEALLASNVSYGQVLGFPFETFGILALVILAVLAATSHDFWLSFLTPPVWKALHLLIYVAYASVVAHVALGALQDRTNPAFAILFGGAALGVGALHLLAWRRGREPVSDAHDWVRVGAAEDIEDQRAVIVKLSANERAAVFRNGNALSAVSNACAHQNGPLGEGRIVDGCITCPWHGFQYRPEDGCSPAPFTEKIPTYNLKLEDGIVFLDPAANPPGTAVPPLAVGAAHA